MLYPQIKPWTWERRQHTCCVHTFEMAVFFSLAIVSCYVSSGSFLPVCTIWELEKWLHLADRSGGGGDYRLCWRRPWTWSHGIYIQMCASTWNNVCDVQWAPIEWNGEGLFRTQEFHRNHAGISQELVQFHRNLQHLNSLSICWVMSMMIPRMNGMQEH